METSSTRRSFLKGGAVLAAPLAAVAAAAPAQAADEAAALKARLARLEDAEAIRALHQAYVRLVNAQDFDGAAALFADAKAAAFDPTMRELAAETAVEALAVDVAEDGLAAAARFGCVVRTEAPIDSDCTLVQMAKLQGDGVIRRTEQRVLETRLVKLDGAWKIESQSFHTA